MRWSRPEQLLVLLAAASVLAGAAALIVAGRSTPEIRVFEAPPAGELVVQVDGAVARPGLYRLPAGARVADAVAAAGGFGASADPSALNLARPLRDGERLTVPTVGAPPAVEPSAAAGSAAAQAPAAGPLDLNTADAAALERLPGIGPVLAGRIVAHRARHGPFRRVEDLLQVEGIGPRLLDRLRHHVVVR